MTKHQTIKQINEDLNANNRKLETKWTKFVDNLIQEEH